MTLELLKQVKDISGKFSDQFYLSESNSKYWKEDLYQAASLLKESGNIELAYSFEKLSELNIKKDYNHIEKLDLLNNIHIYLSSLINEGKDDYDKLAEISESIFSFEQIDDLSQLRNEAKAGVDKAMVEMFVEESENLLDNVNNNLLEFENDPQNGDLVNSLFRALHTIKGNSATLGFDMIKEVSHKVESVFDQFRKGSLFPDALTIDILRVAIESISEMVGCIVKESDYQGDISEIIKSLNDIKSGKKPDPKPIKDNKNKSESMDLKPLKTRSIKDSLVAQNKSLRVSTDKLNKIVTGIGEVNIISHTIMESIRETYEVMLKKQLVSDQDVENVFNAIDAYSTQLSDLYNSIINTRMIPLAGIFKKYPVIVRDLARNTSKKVSFSYSGENIEVDKQIFEEIADPIMHLIRNCIDHGIEKPSERTSKGKDEEGLVKLDAHIEGGVVYIVVSDNGAGISKERVLSKALEKGLLTESQAEDMTSSDIYNLIFEPGFSTKDKATELSGRGVGMDVVRNNIVKLRGSVKVESVEGQGVTFTLSMPASLANQEILVVSEDIHTTGIPVEFVVEVIDVSPSKIQLLDNKEVLEYRGHLIPFIYMRNVFGVKSIGHSKSFKTVILKVYDNFFAVSVDAIERRQKVVIKPLSQLIKNTRYINSGSIMGDGHILLILDVYSVFEDLNRVSMPVLKKKDMYKPTNELIDELGLDSSDSLYIVDDDRTEYIMFTIADKLFAMGIQGIHQVMELPDISVFPELPDGVIGVYEYMDRVIPVYDMPNKVINDFVDDESLEKKVIIYEKDSIMIGILCHKINKIIRLEDSEVSSLVSINDGLSMPIVKGLCKWDEHEVLVIDEENLFKKFKNINVPSVI